MIKLTVERRQGAIADAVQTLNAADIGVEDIGLRRPTLDEVFLTLTGHALETDGDDNEEEGK